MKLDFKQINKVKNNEQNINKENKESYSGVNNGDCNSNKALNESFYLR